MKRCRDCNKVKPLEEFGVAKLNKDGRQGHCKMCSTIRVRRWYASKRDSNKLRKNYRPKVSIGGFSLGDNKNWKWRQYLDDKCRRCGFTPEDGCQLTIDHIDKNKKNNSVENLQTLCANCHNYKSKVELIEPDKLLLLNLIPSSGT